MVTLKYLPRYKELAWFLIKYGRIDIVKELGVPVISPKEVASQAATAHELACDLQKLGPTFIKLGQLLSTQVDFLPEVYQDALANLEDNVDTFSYERVEKIVASELGVKIKDAFAEFDSEPLACASLSQVHRAKLMSGRSVVVKIQKPDIAEQIVEDLNMLEELAIFLDKREIFGKHYYWQDRIKSMRRILLCELDFKKEAHNLAIFAENLREFENIKIPYPVEGFTTARILTMEYISSEKITTLHPLLKLDIDGRTLMKELLRAYLKQIFVDGFVHIDPHPGNIYLTDSKKLALLDLGMVEHLTVQFQQDLLKLIIAISDGKGEDAAQLIIKLGSCGEDFNHFKFQEELSDLIAIGPEMRWEEIGMGALFFRIVNCAANYNVRLPQKFNTLGKTLLNLDKIGKVLAPTLNPSLFIRNNIENVIAEKFKILFSKATLSNMLLEVTDLLRLFPARLNKFLELLEKNEFKIKLQAFDEHRLMRGFEKIANRITLGLMIASMIIGAALLMQVHTEFQILGYSGLAILLFLGAFLGALIFIVNILLHDEKSRKE